MTAASMRDLPSPYLHLPLDQADGLRRLFGGRGRHVLALAANPYVPFGGIVLDRVAAVLAAAGHEVLVVDAAASSPAPHELARLNLAACIERVALRVSYLPARGLPLSYVDTRGSAGAFIDALQQAAPQAEVLLLHAEALDLARLLKRREVRPLLMGADHPESIKHAYASCKLLVQRCGLMSYDLLLAASPLSPRAVGIAASLGSCADGFLGAALRDWALIDPAGDAADAPDEALARLLGAQLELHEMAALPYGAAVGARPAPADLNPPRPVYR
ncbi:MAG: flagellar biosynthesis protein [Rubrivivax sp.]|nr:flagellar biosynthesis protein [Rubrivivax sp.]